MAPVTGRIANRQKNGLVFFFSRAKRFVTPWVPIHRIMSVLKQIRTRFMYQLISMFWLDAHGTASFRFKVAPLSNYKKK
jgi:hypothetical protein